jgi:hypothetical protein
LRGRLPRPTFANAISLIAIFVALGGTAVAITALERNSVKSRHIARGAVKQADLGANAVNSAKVANGSLREADFAAGQLPAGPTGPQGVTGIAGPAGPTSGSTEFSSGSASVPGCAQAYALDYPVSVSQPSKIFATGTASFKRNGAADNIGTMVISLLDTTLTTEIGRTGRVIADPGLDAEEIPMTASGVLADLGTGAPVTVGPGEYVLRLSVENLGTCGDSATYREPTLSHILIGG